MLKTARVPQKFEALFERAQSFVTRYFAELAFAPEQGRLELSGQRYVLVRAAALSVEFYEMVRNFYGAEAEARSVAHALLFDVAHAMGISDAKVFAERMQLTDPIARLSAGPLHFAHAGWAFVDISEESAPSADDQFYLLYDHPYSFESDSWLNAGKHSDCPVCVMNAGYSSGWCESSFDVRLVASEILCRAKGDAVCRFIMAPPQRVEAHVERYRADHPELAPSIVNYQIPGFFSKHTDRQLLLKNVELELSVEARTRELAAINERLKRDIEERGRAEAALSETKELNERLIEALPGGVVHVAKSGAILRANAEATRILGLAYDELTDRYVADFDTQTIWEDGAPAAFTDYPVSKAIMTGEPQPATTLGVRKPSGEVAWAVFRAVPVRDQASGDISGAIVTFFDITERKRFEDKLRQTQKLESLGVLAGGIAHDFNNLLVTILGNASLGRTIASADPKLLPLLEEIEIGARRAADLTKQMLDYAGQGRFMLESVELSAMVREMAKLVKALIPNQVELHYQFQEGLPKVEADPTQLRQVIMNLLTNAAEAMDDRPGRVVVSVGHRYVSEGELEQYLAEGASAGSFASLEVRDTGSGMNEETRSRIFDPFFTTKFKGRGLGMAAVLGIIRSHRGAIRIESRPAKGTRVEVLLPTRYRALEPVQREAETPVLATILVVDDEDAVRLIARRALTMHGYQVLDVASGVEALRVIEQRNGEIGLVLLDVTMPEMNGFETLRGIRASGSKIPVLLSSGYELGNAEIERFELCTTLEKPYDIEQLLAAVENALKRAPN